MLLQLYCNANINIYIFPIGHMDEWVKDVLEEEKKEEEDST